MIKAKYVGAGDYLNGIPARDLTEADWAQLTSEQQVAVATSPLYEIQAAKKTAKKDGE